MVRIERCIGIGAVAFAALAIAAGCGGGDDAPKADSFAGISESISKPTGTVDQTTAGKIGAEFDKTNSATAGAANAFGSVRGDDQVAASGSGSYTHDCAAGGTISATSTASNDGNQTSGRADEQIDNCCYTAGCCANGSATLYFSGSTSTGSAGSSSVTDDYSLCMNFNVSTQCDGNSYSGSFSGCLGAGGTLVYNIEVDGKTYAVSGTFGSGSGTLSIQGANGTFQCTYATGSGSCSGPNGSFSFTSSS